MYECQASVVSHTNRRIKGVCVKEEDAGQESYLDLGENKEEIQENYRKKIL